MLISVQQHQLILRLPPDLVGNFNELIEKE